MSIKIFWSGYKKIQVSYYSRTMARKGLMQQGCRIGDLCSNTNTEPKCDLEQVIAFSTLWFLYLHSGDNYTCLPSFLRLCEDERR